MPMAATASEPRYPPWLRRALAKSAESSRIRSPTDSKRTSDSRKTQVPAQSAAPVAVSGFPLAADEAEIVWDAAARDDVGRVSAYVDEHKQRVFVRRDLLRRVGGGESLLHVAATHGSVEVMRFLVAFLEANFSHDTQRQAVNAVDTVYSRTTPLIAACRSSGGVALNRLEILKLLVRGGATTTAVDAHGDNVLHWCARKGSAALLRFFLMETDASGGAAFARNNKRETVSCQRQQNSMSPLSNKPLRCMQPLDIAQRRLRHNRTLTTSTVYSLLRNVDRECNLRLRIQLICRGQGALSAQAMAHDSDQLRRCIESAELLTQRSVGTWSEALKQAEKYRQRAEEDSATTASEHARSQALEWLESKDGKAYVKKQAPVATAELKQLVQNGTVPKPKDMKKAAAQFAAESFAQKQAQNARQEATNAFQAQRPPFPSVGVISTTVVSKLLGL